MQIKVTIIVGINFFNIVLAKLLCRLGRSKLGTATHSFVINKCGTLDYMEHRAKSHIKMTLDFPPDYAHYNLMKLTTTETLAVKFRVSLFHHALTDN